MMLLLRRLRLRGLDNEDLNQRKSEEDIRLGDSMAVALENSSYVFRTEGLHGLLGWELLNSPFRFSEALRG